MKKYGIGCGILCRLKYEFGAAINTYKYMIINKHILNKMMDVVDNVSNMMEDTSIILLLL